MTRKQLVIVDLDGTLIDSAPDLGAAADKMRTDRGLPALPLEHYRPMAGAGARGMLECAFGMPPEHPDFSAFKEEFFANYEACLTERTQVFHGVDDLIQRIRQSMPLELLTKGANKTACLELMGEQAKDGSRKNPPPAGLNYTAIQTVGVRKPTKK